MVADIVFALVFILFGGLLGLTVETQKHLYPINLALLLLIAAELPGLLEKAIAWHAERYPMTSLTIPQSLAGR